MNPDPDRSDSLLDILADGAAHLPAVAAQAALEHRIRQARYRRRLAGALVLVLLGVCGWQSIPWMRPGKMGGERARHFPSEPAGARLENVVLVQTGGEPLPAPLPPPPGATEEQKELLTSARGLPLLLVMDAPGQPARIVVVER